MIGNNRREFLADVGRGMLVASLGSFTAMELGLSAAVADDASERLTFGPLEPLVTLLQETAPRELLPILVDRLNHGTELPTLVQAAALANARAFGGQDYTGFHTFMALLPAYQMASELPTSRRALPVLKVLYRNSSRIEEQGFQHHDTLAPVSPLPAGAAACDGPSLRAAVRDVEWERAESCFASMTEHDLTQAFDGLQLAVQDEVDVHRVVLAWRAWAVAGLTGEEFARTLLRQSVRYCLNTEQALRDQGRPRSPVRELLPQLLDQYRLLSKPLGQRRAEDEWIDRFAHLVFSGTREQAADATAAALAEGMHPDDVGEAISLAANLLVLHDPGRRAEYSTSQKPAGCVHGDSVGVHASDAANAWRNIARVSAPRNQIASLIVGAFHTAGQSAWVTETPYPYADLLDEIDAHDPAALLGQAEAAIRANDQARACAAVHRYGEVQRPLRPLADLLLKYAVSEDGALHAEKYYRTVSEEFATTRPTFRWRQWVALARVTASEYGFPAPGYAEACQLLGVSASV